MGQAETPSSPVHASSVQYVVGIDIGSQTCSSCALKPNKNQVIKPTEFTNAPAEKLLPSIVSTYTSLVSQNISRLADRLAFFRFSDASMLVELTHEPSPPGVPNDVLRIAYVLLPTVQLTAKYLVYTCNEKDSVAHVPFIETTLQGWRTEASGMRGAHFGRAALSRHIENRLVHEPEAYFCFTRFPSHYPILDQAYQLLGNEVGYLLEGDLKDSYDVEIGKSENEQLDGWISKHIPMWLT